MVMSYIAGIRPAQLQNPMGDATKAYVRMAVRSARSPSTDNLADLSECLPHALAAHKCDTFMSVIAADCTLLQHTCMTQGPLVHLPVDYVGVISSQQVLTATARTTTCMCMTFGICMDATNCMGAGCYSFSRLVKHLYTAFTCECSLQAQAARGILGRGAALGMSTRRASWSGSAGRDGWLCAMHPTRATPSATPSRCLSTTTQAAAPACN